MSLSDILLRELAVERSDSILVGLGRSGALHIPSSTDIVAHLVLEGSVDILLEKGGERATLRAGEYAVLFYGSEHRIVLSDDDSGMEAIPHAVTAWPTGDEPPVITLGTSPLGSRCISAALRTIVSPFTIRAQRPVPDFLHFHHDKMSTPVRTVLLSDAASVAEAARGPGASALITALMNLYLFQTIRWILDEMSSHAPQIANTAEFIRSPHRRPVAVAMRMLRMHPEKPWTVAALARQLGQSRTLFATSFRECVGVGPIEYLSVLRMEKAAEMLRTRPDLTSSTVARQVGYANANAFARAFKTHFGVPPKSFLGKR